MKLRVNFGEEMEREVYWYKDLNDFPHVLSYDNKKWEWAMYTKGAGSIDYELTFAELLSYTPAYYATAIDFEDLLKGSARSYDCQCGAKYTSFPFDHLRYCPKWRPWSYL